MKYINNMLSSNEMQLMEIFWKLEKPLSSVELTPYFEEWKNGYLHNLLKGLHDRGILAEYDIVQYGRRYAKQYIPSMSKEQYAAKVISNMNVTKKNLSKVAIALVEEISDADQDGVIEELESILHELKEKNKKR